MTRYSMSVFFTLLLSISLISSVANAADIMSSEPNNDQQINLEDIILAEGYIATGETTFSILFWDLYKSKLLTTSGRYPITPEADSLIFHINYLADISSEDLIMRTVEQWQHLGIREEQYQGYLNELKNLWPDITEGDNLALLIKDKKSIFYFNGQAIGVINDAKFGPMFVDIWLSKNTSQPGLRAELLGDSYYE